MLVHEMLERATADRGGRLWFVNADDDPSGIRLLGFEGDLVLIPPLLAPQHHRSIFLEYGGDEMVLHEPS